MSVGGPARRRSGRGLGRTRAQRRNPGDRPPEQHRTRARTGTCLRYWHGLPTPTIRNHPDLRRFATTGDQARRMDTTGPESSYFERVGAHRFVPTGHAGGAWATDEQHFSPLGGLVVHEIERVRAREQRPALVLSRISMDRPRHQCHLRPNRPGPHRHGPARQPRTHRIRPTDPHPPPTAGCRP